MTKTLVTLMMVAGAVLFAASPALATAYSWTGNAGDGKWSTKSNWNPSTGYPKAAADTITFSSSATVTLDTGVVTQFKTLYVADDGGTVTINAAAKSSFKVASGGAIGYGNNSTLYLNVPVNGAGTMTFGQHYKTGAMHIASAYTNTAQITYLAGLGDFYIESGTDWYMNNKPLAYPWAGNGGVDPNHAYVTGNAKIVVTSREFTMPGNGGTNIKSGWWTQDGDDTVIDVGSLHVGGQNGSTSGNLQGNHDLYELKRGSLKTSTFYFGMRRQAQFIQTGGTADVGTICFNNVQSTGASATSGTFAHETNGNYIAILGGTFITKKINDSTLLPIILSNATLKASGTFDTQTRLDIVGNATFDANAGMTGTFSRVRYVAGDTITKVGAGTVVLNIADFGGHEELNAVTSAGSLIFALTSPEGFAFKRSGTGGGLGIRAVGDFLLKPNSDGTDYEFDELAPGYTADGTLTLSNLTANVKTLLFPQEANSNGKLSLVNSTLNAEAISALGPYFKIAMTNSTFALKRASAPSAQTTVTLPYDFVLSAGTNTIEVSENLILDVTGNFSLQPGTVLRKTGAGYLKLSHDMIVKGDIDIVDGRLSCTDSYYFENEEGDESVHKLFVRSGATFHVGGYNAEISTPIDLYIETKFNGSTYEGGTLTLDNRMLLAVKHFYTNLYNKTSGAYSQWYKSGPGELVDRSKTGRFVIGANAVVAVPFIWTGGGEMNEDGSYNYVDSDNWEDGNTPTTTYKIDPYAKTKSAQYAYVDLSAANDVVINRPKNGVVDVGGIIYNPNSGTKKLRIFPKYKTEGYNVMRVNRGSYQPAMFTGRGRSVTFDDLPLKQEGSSNWGLHGNGIYYIEGDNGPWLYSNQPCFDNIFPTATLYFRNASNASYTPPTWQFRGFGYSKVVIGENTDLRLAQLNVLGGNSFTTLRCISQIAGSKFTVASLYITPPRDYLNDEYGYRLEGGVLNVDTLYLGAKIDSSHYAYQGGSFQMSGGTLNVTKLCSEYNSNYYYFFGGDVYVGAGGMEKTVSSSRSKFVSNTTPSIVLGGSAMHASADFTCALDIEPRGAGWLDLNGHTVTMNANIDGVAALPVTGQGTFSVLVNGSATAAIDLSASSALEFPAAFSQTAPFKSLKVADGDKITVASGTVQTKELIIGTEAKPAGTYTFLGGGQIEVLGNSDWMASAPWSQAAEISISGEKSVTGLSYSCQVSDAGTCTISGDDAAKLIFTEADNTIYVAKGDTLVINVPVHIKATNGTLSFRGGGKVILKQPLTWASNCAYGSIYDGCEVVLEAKAQYGWWVRLCSSTKTNLSKLTLGNGGWLQMTDPKTLFYSVAGGIVEILEGGTFVFDDNGEPGATKTYGTNTERHEEIRLAGGTLKAGRINVNQLVNYDAYLTLQSGTVYATGLNEARPLARNTRFTDDAGTINFEIPYSASLSGEYENPVVKELKKSGDGTLYFETTLSATEKYNLAGGTWYFDQVAAKAIPTTASFYFNSATNTLFALDYEGEAEIGSLWNVSQVRSRQLMKGRYGENEVPDPKMLKYAPSILGSGYLRTLTGDATGPLVILR